jgi:hypothetical protein
VWKETVRIGGADRAGKWIDMSGSRYRSIGRSAAAVICAAAVALAYAHPQLAPYAASISFRQPAGFAPRTFERHADTPQPTPGLGQNPESRALSNLRGGRQQRLSAASGMPYRPTSANAHNGQRPPGNVVYLRAGSIRDAVTRYNEERGASRTSPRPSNPAARPPDAPDYRN